MENFGLTGFICGPASERGNWPKVEKYIQRQGKPKEDLKQIRLFRFSIPRGLPQDYSLNIDRKKTQ